MREVAGTEGKVRWEEEKGRERATREGRGSGGEGAKKGGGYFSFATSLGISFASILPLDVFVAERF